MIQEMRLALRNNGKIDPCSIDSYIAAVDIKLLQRRGKWIRAN